MRAREGPARAVAARRRVALGVLAALSAGAIHGTLAARTLTIGVTDARSLLVDISEQVLREAFRRAGWGIEFKPLPLPRAIEAANDGDIDGDIHRIAEVAQKYPNLVAVPTPINRVDVAVYGTSPTIAGLSRAEVAKLRVGVARGTFVLAKYSAGMTVTDVRSVLGTVEMMHAGRLDAAVALYLDTELVLADGRAGGIHLWPYLWASEPLYFILNKRHAELGAPLNAVLQQMQREGLIEQAYQEGLRSVKIRPLRSDRSVRSDSRPEQR